MRRRAAIGWASLAVWWRVLIFLLGLALLALLVVLALKWAPEWLETGGLKRKDRADEIGRNRTAVLATLAGLIAVVGAIFTGLSYRLNRAGQITERFTRAIDQIGNAELDVRLGGIYALERIARDSRDDHPQVVEVLTAYVREHSPWPPKSSSTRTGTEPGSESLAGLIEAIYALERIAKGTELGGAISAAEPSGEPAPSEAEAAPPPLPTDVRAAMSVLGRRDGRQDRSGAPLDLIHTNLREADLTKADLKHARLNGANLQEASLGEADLKDAFLVRANLQGAGLPGANLKGASLDGANLKGASLVRANLKGASLVRANLQGARYDIKTKWPEGFDPKAAGALRIDEDEEPGSVPPPD